MFRDSAVSAGRSPEPRRRGAPGTSPHRKASRLPCSSRTARTACAFAQDGRPGEPRLRALEHDHLVEVAVVVGRRAPLLVVIGGVERIAGGHPAAPGSGVVRGSQWAILDSNQGPPPYQSGALTD